MYYEVDRVPGKPGVPTHGRAREHLGRGRPLRVVSPGLEVSRGGFFQDRLVQLRIGKQAFQAGVLLLQLFQALRLIGTQTTALFLETRALRQRKYVCEVTPINFAASAAVWP